MNQNDDQLTRELHARAADAPHHPLTLDDVKRTAHRMKWQRRAVAGTAAAVVLAIAIPVGLSVTAGADRSNPDIAPSPNPAPTLAPTQVVLTTDVSERSGEPAVPYLYDGAINLPNGSQVEVSGSYDGLARFGDGWVLTGQDESANRFVRFVDANGAEVATYPGTGEVELSRDGTLLSYFETSDDSLHVVGADGLPGWTLPTNGETELYPAAVFGSETCEETEGAAGCSVWFNDQFNGGSGVSTSGGTVGEVGFEWTGGNSSDGAVIGRVSSTDYGSCSELQSPPGTTLWQTCDYTLGKFSPDDRLVMGYPAYRDGIGDNLVAILDAATGDLVAEYKANRKTQAYTNTVIWETDTSLLATVYQDGTWSLMRMTMDGELSKVADVAGGDDSSPPLSLPVVP